MTSDVIEGRIRSIDCANTPSTDVDDYSRIETWNPVVKVETQHGSVQNVTARRLHGEHVGSHLKPLAGYYRGQWMLVAGLIHDGDYVWVQTDEARPELQVRLHRETRCLVTIGANR